MIRYKITIEYDGSGSAGWQRQINANTIQQYIEEAIIAFSHEITPVHAAGRTDAGVHALAQVAHFDLTKLYPVQIVKRALNHFLRKNKIGIIACEIVDQSFHARYKATKRYYHYIILNRPAFSVLEENRCWHIRENLDLEQMQLAANILVGMHDFTSFRTVKCQSLSPIKTLDIIDIERLDKKIMIKFQAQSFLHHMVRNIVGTLVEVGLGKVTIDEVREILAAKNRRAAGPTAPAHGLYFSRVDYD